MIDLTKQQRAELRATYGAPQHQIVALGARLLCAQARTMTNDIKPFAIACIRMQTFFGPPAVKRNAATERCNNGENK